MSKLNFTAQPISAPDRCKHLQAEQKRLWGDSEWLERTGWARFRFDNTTKLFLEVTDD